MTLQEKGLQKFKKIIPRIVKQYAPEKIILFGSYAWGKPDFDSDLDILLIKKGKKNYIKEQQKIRRIIDGRLAVDILIYTPEELKKRLKLGDQFMHEVVNKGIYLHGRQN